MHKHSHIHIHVYMDTIIYAYTYTHILNSINCCYLEPAPDYTMFILHVAVHFL